MLCVGCPQSVNLVSLVFCVWGVNVHFVALKGALNTLTHFTQSVSVLYIASFTINEVCAAVCLCQRTGETVGAGFGIQE